ncbi:MULTISPECIES: hypothetical protein [unclassified Variovorax]|uniref:hypothetical protein n=1 Tax=unclassified Variovorax TaxID=663243 RepID=UPI0032E7766C
MKIDGRTELNRCSLKALFLGADAERHLRKVYEDAGVPNLPTEKTRQRIPPLLDYGNIHITDATESDFYEGIDLLALAGYCRDSIAVSRREGAAPVQSLYDTHGVVYSYYWQQSLHVVGLSCMRADGRLERRTLICREPLCEVLFYAPVELLAAANANQKAWVSELHEDEGEEFDLLLDEEVEDANQSGAVEPAPLARLLSQRRPVSRKKVRPSASFAVKKKPVAKRPKVATLRLVKPSDQSL